MACLNNIVGMNPEAFWLMAKLVGTYISDNPKGTHVDIANAMKADIPNIDDLDVNVLIDAVPRLGAVRAKVMQNRIDLDRQDKLVDEIERVFGEGDEVQLRGLLLRLDQQVRERNAPDADLQGIVKNIEKALKQIRNVKAPKKRKQKMLPAEEANLRAALKDLRAILRLKKKIADIDQQLLTGEFHEPAPPRRTTVFSKGLERAQIDLRLKEKDLALAIIHTRPLSKADLAFQVFALPRALKATGDMSSFMRQSVWFIPSHPVKWARSAMKGVPAYFSRRSAEAVDQLIRNDPRFYIWQKHKGYHSPLEVGPFRQMEEAWQSRLLQNFPPMMEYVRQVLAEQGVIARGKKIVTGGAIGFNLLSSAMRAAERAFVTQLNLLRFGVFTGYLDNNPTASEAALDIFAQYINEGTGRGTLKPQTVETMNKFLFSPRFSVSRFQTPARMFQMLKHPELRKEVARQMVSTVATGTTVLGLAHFALPALGLNIAVGSDPEDSDFGKIVIGNTRVDIWGGFQSAASFILRLGLGALDVVGVRELDNKNLLDPYELMARFSIYKINPGISTPLAAAFKKTPIGEELTWSEVFEEGFLPLFAQDIVEAFEETGVAGGVASIAPAFTGVSVSTYGNELKSVDIKRVLRRADYRPAPPKFREDIRNDILVKRELQDTFAALFALRVRANQARVDILSGPALKKELQGYARDVRASMKHLVDQEERFKDLEIRERILAQ